MTTQAQPYSQISAEEPLRNNHVHHNLQYRSYLTAGSLVCLDLDYARSGGGFSLPSLSGAGDDHYKSIRNSPFVSNPTHPSVLDNNEHIYIYIFFNSS